MKTTSIIEAAPLVRALEAAWYAMEKHAPNECEREIRYADEILQRFKGLGIERLPEALEMILFNAILKLEAYGNYSARMSKIGRGFTPSNEISDEGLLSIMRDLYSQLYPDREPKP